MSQSQYPQMSLLKKFFLSLSVLLITGFIWLLLQEPKLVSTSVFLSPLAPDQETEPVLESPRLNPDQLVLDLKDFLASQSGTWGVAITQLTINHQSLNIDTFGLNLDRSFPAASIMKVLVAANLINRVDKNEFSLEKEVEGRILKELIRSMINQTENEAWEVLNNFLGLKQIQSFGESLGMENLNIYDNTLSPKDVNILLSALYQNKVASANLTSLLLTFMQDTETEGRIPAALPETVKVYHKAGSWSPTGTYSDTAIIEVKNPFILTLLSENVPSRLQATETIKVLTRKIFTVLMNS